jgi:pimeloyl-ACP methyl ester carboxylesterase
MTNQNDETDAPAPRVRSATLDGITIRYDDYGEGPDALVFLHGWACSSAFWRLQIPAFIGRIRIIAIDFPGHGESDKPEIDYTEELFARSVDAVMRDAGVERVALVGHSMGTPVARTFDALFPGRTVAMIFVDGALRPTQSEEAADQEFAALATPAYDTIMPQIFTKIIGPTMEASLRERTLADMLATPKYVVISAGRNLENPASYPSAAIAVPVLAIMAKASNWPADNESYYRSVAPEIDYQEWDDTGHFVMLERPDDFNAAVVEALERIAFLAAPISGV